MVGTESVVIVWHSDVKNTLCFKLVTAYTLIKQGLTSLIV
jgi:hypothetical protein